MNHQRPEEIEEINPFPDDGSYQENKEVKMEKIPIKIYGSNHFHLFADAGGEISSGLPCGGGLGTLEEGIGRVMRGCRQNARAYLNFLKGGIAEQEDEKKIAEILISQDSLEELFVLVYPKSNKETIEKQLGKHNKLEKKIV